MKLADIIVDKQLAHAENVNYDMPSGTVGATLSLSLSPEWDGLSVTVEFVADDVKMCVVNASEEVVVPPEIFRKASVTLYVGICGHDSSGALKMPTNWVALIDSILEGSACSCAPPLPPYPGWSEQIETQINDNRKNIKNNGEAIRVNTQGIADLSGSKQDLLSGELREFVTFNEKGEAISRPLLMTDLGGGLYVCAERADVTPKVLINVTTKEELEAVLSGEYKDIQNPARLPTFGIHFPVLFAGGNSLSEFDFTFFDDVDRVHYPATVSTPDGVPSFTVPEKLVGVQISCCFANGGVQLINPPYPPYSLPQATQEFLGGVKANKAGAEDTQPVNIRPDGTLWVNPAAGGGVTKKYTDNQDAVTLAKANKYSDEQDAVTLKTASSDATNKATQALNAAVEHTDEVAAILQLKDITLKVVLQPDGTTYKAYLGQDETEENEYTYRKVQAAIARGVDVKLRDSDDRIYRLQSESGRQSGSPSPIYRFTHEITVGGVSKQRVFVWRLSGLGAELKMETHETYDGRYVAKSLYVASAPEAVEKTVFLPGGAKPKTPEDNSVLLIKFENGSTTDNVTLKIGDGSWEMARNPWRYSDIDANCPVGEIPVGHTILVHLDGTYAFWQDCGYRPLVVLMEKQFQFDMMKLIKGERQEKVLIPEQYPLADEIEHPISQIGEVYGYFGTYKALIRLSNFNSSPAYFRFNANDLGREFIFNYDKESHTVSAYQIPMIIPFPQNLTVAQQKQVRKNISAQGLPVIKSDDGTSSGKRKVITWKNANDYSKPGNRVVWFVSKEPDGLHELDDADFATIHNGERILIDVLVDDGTSTPKQAYLDCVVTAVDSKSCSCIGIALHFGSIIDDSKVSEKTTYSSAKINQAFAPVVPVTEIGTVITSDMVSPEEHDVGCKIERVNKFNGELDSWTPSRVCSASGIELPPDKEFSLFAEKSTNAPHFEIKGGNVLYDTTNNYFQNYEVVASNVNTFRSSSKYKYYWFRVWNTNEYYGIDKSTKIMIVEADRKPTEFVPYISNLADVKVSRFGKNLIDYKKALGAQRPSIKLELVDNGVKWTGAYYFLIPVNIPAGVNLALSCKGDISKWELLYSDGSSTGGRGIGSGFLAEKAVTGIALNKPEPAVPGTDMVVTDIMLSLQQSLSPVFPEYVPYHGDTYTPSPDGTVSGMTSIQGSKDMTILTDTPGVTINAEYNADTKAYIDNKFTELQALALDLKGGM